MKRIPSSIKRVAVNENVLLIDERDKNAGSDAQLKRIFSIDLSNATNILGKYDDQMAARKTLEQMSIDELKANGIMPPSKRTVLDLVAFEYPYEKVEGLSLVNGDTIVIVNDNDFGIGSNSTETRNCGRSNCLIYWSNCFDQHSARPRPHRSPGLFYD